MLAQREIKVAGNLQCISKAGAMETTMVQLVYHMVPTKTPTITTTGCIILNHTVSSVDKI